MIIINDNLGLVIYNVYIPNRELIYEEEIEQTFYDLRYYTTLFNKYGYKQILGGDFNSRIGNKSGDIKLDSNGRKLLQFINDRNVLLCNIKKYKGCATFHGFWKDKKLKKLRNGISIIDYFLIYNINSFNSYNFYIKNIFCNTDHYPIFVMIKFDTKNNINRQFNLYFLSSYSLKFKKTKNDEFLQKTATLIVKEFKNNGIIKEIQNKVNCINSNIKRINKI